MTNRYYGALLALVIGRLWLLPMRDGFWLDETGTVWAIRGSFREVLARCITWPSQTPGYSVLAWLFFRLPGPHEVMLRLLSVLAMAVATFLLFQLAKRVVGSGGAWPTAILFASIEPVAFAASDARPYAVAMLSVMAATYLLVRWFDTSNRIYALGYCVAASLIPYFHFIFGVTLLFHVVYAVYRSRLERRIPMSYVFSAAALIGVFLAPLAVYMSALLKTGSHHAFAGSPDLASVFSIVAPPAIVGAILLVLLICVFAKLKFQFDLAELDPASLLLVASWIVLPIACLYVLSSLTSVKAFLPRYILPSEAGIALLMGWLLSGISPVRLRFLTTSSAAIAVLLVAPGPRFAHGGDWRVAMASVRQNVGDSGMPVLVRSDFPESEPFDWLEDPSRKEYLLAPLGVYQSAGTLVPLPMYFTPDISAYLNNLAPRLEQGNAFLLVNMGDGSYQNWLSGRFASAGFERKRIGSYGGSLTVDKYVRSAQIVNHDRN